MRPQSVGILAIQSYIPSTCVNQSELEKYDKIPEGKYTVGLGLNNMSIVGDREDINSISQTAVLQLLEKNHINPHHIGRIEIGTETILDKSKSTKTYLMQIFQELGNYQIEGITSLNACYGAVQALFNTVAWIESSSWDGRLGIVVAADIAVYDKGPARSTGGAGAVAILIGPNANLVLEPIRTTYMEHAYDFYKPMPDSEYPLVEGQHSIQCYLNALEYCYNRMKERKNVQKIEELADYYIFHSPFYKMIQKAFLKLYQIDILQGQRQQLDLNEYANFDDRMVQQKLGSIANGMWNRVVEPSCLTSKELGNTYCASIFNGLVSLLCNYSTELLDKRIALFAYGSGLASTLFTLKISSHAEQFLISTRENNELQEQLSTRIRVSPEEYNRRMDKRERNFLRNDYQPEDSIAELKDGTVYLTQVDDRFKRYYSRKVNPKPKL